VLILNGPGRGRGCGALLLRINENDFNCDVRVVEGRHSGRVLEGVDYEHISK
jgi:hypothetical protein